MIDMDVFIDEDLYYVTAQDASEYLSRKHGRPIQIKSVCHLARRKRHPVRTYAVSNRRLYCLDDLALCNIRERAKP
jgi:hypothetical protein